MLLRFFQFKYVKSEIESYMKIIKSSRYGMLHEKLDFIYLLYIQSKESNKFLSYRLRIYQSKLFSSELGY